MPADVPSRDDAAAALFSEFVTPPAPARPRVWWHWMDGNVNEAGIVKDLEWLKSVGVGGVQAFNGAMGTPAYTPEPVAFRSPAWRSAMSCAAATADRLGLELSIATSAGWSATGGPWVRPAAGMKKLVWTTTRVSAARVPARAARLAVPPSNSGPYQDVPFAAVRQANIQVPDHFEDVAVLAFPARPGHLPLEPSAVSSGTTAAGAAAGDGQRPLASLSDGSFWPAMELPMEPGSAGAGGAVNPQAWILAEFPEPTAVGSVRVGLPSRRGFRNGPRSPGPSRVKYRRRELHSRRRPPGVRIPGALCNLPAGDCPVLPSGS
ncbi:glycosyl hydrolase [Arthrobacter sp. UC242_113]|uniref:glycosyl hydrolase n=1 Tax=Arthrobacter sp. UC242_113 TaxID=3374550 RepID=UPI003756E748